MKLRSLLYAGAMLAMVASCKDDRTAKLDETAEEVADKREDLADEREDLAEADEQEEALAQRADVAHASADLSKAEVDFERRRLLLVNELRFRHHLYATQTAIARGILADPTLAEGDRQDATDKILTLERELGEAQLAVDAVATSTAAQWDGVHVTVENAFQQLEGAHDDAFDALAADRKLAPAGTLREGYRETKGAVKKEGVQDTKDAVKRY
jgi:hypothetical protein